MKYFILSTFTIFLITFTSCIENRTKESIDTENIIKKDYKINLKLYKSYAEDSFDRNKIGLKWCLSYLGSTIASDTLLNGIKYSDSIISLDVKHLGFSKKASEQLAKLQYILKSSEDYKTHNAFDIGRYIALTLGSVKHYYAITGASKNITTYKTKYNFNELDGYIDNSGVSKVDRIISHSIIKDEKSQSFISTEIDSITKEIQEYETFDIMPNGQLKFAIYNSKGYLKDAADSNVTQAGKPAKCIWCHEVRIIPLFKEQQDHKGYLNYLTFKDSLKSYNEKLQAYQNQLWKDENLLNKKLHTELEILYISFMEPSAKRIAQEWNITEDEVREKLKGLSTHVHDEFPFLGDLYDRKHIDKLAPYMTIEVPESIREKSSNEVNYLN